MVNFDGADHQHTAQTVVLKGALLLQTIGITAARPTMDIDMLREGKADQATLTALVKDASLLGSRCAAPVYHPPLGRSERRRRSREVALARNVPAHRGNLSAELETSVRNCLRS